MLIEFRSGSSSGPSMSLSSFSGSVFFSIDTLLGVAVLLAAGLYLKLYRELEAFSKFSGDMDPVTALTIDKGQKNTRLLVQPQYCPMPVEKQVAILYCGTHGLLKNVPLAKVSDFERSFLDTLEMNHREDVLDVLKKGVIDDDVCKKLEETAEMVARQFS